MELSQKQTSDSGKGRRTYLINPAFQLSFLAYSLGIAAVTTGIFLAADLYFFWKFEQMGTGLGLSPDHVFFQFLREQKTSKFTIYGIATAINFGAISIWGLLLSHRVAGPIHRLKTHFTKGAETGTVEEVQFRKKDFFPEVAEAYNLQINRIRKDFSESKKLSG